MSDRKKKFRRDVLERNLAQIESEMAKQKHRSSSKYDEMKEDNVQRQQIQATIQKMAKDGKGKVEILTHLMNEFPDPEKSKYYAIWIDNKFKHLKIKDENEQGR